MTREEIIRMAREAGMEHVVDVHKDGTRTIELPHPDLLQRFAALVAEHERQECAKVCELMEQQAEGTECCKWPTPIDCAAAIRERSTNEL